MGFFKWRAFLISGTVCLLTILPGIVLWNKLPNTMAIHFNVYGVADNFAPKGFAVFGIPLLMVILQAFCCFVNDINAHKHGERKKFETVTKWIIPFLTVTLQAATLGYALGWGLDIRKTVAFIVGLVLIVIGNYLPKLDYVKNGTTDTEKARKINRFLGYETVVMGILFLISIFLPPVYTVVCLLLLIPYAITGIAYGIITGKELQK